MNFSVSFTEANMKFITSTEELYICEDFLQFDTCYGYLLIDFQKQPLDIFKWRKYDLCKTDIKFLVTTSYIVRH